MVTTATCPRCGYDLRGSVETWREACPMWGQCTECGVALWWAEVLRPDKFEPPWCIEFARRRDGLLRAAASTFLRSWRPFRFWTNLTMAMPVRGRRLALYAALLALPMLAAYVGMQAAAALRVHALMQQQLLVQQSQARKILGGTAAGQAAMPALNQPWWAAVLEAVAQPLASRSAGTVRTMFGTQPYVAPIRLHGVINDQLGQGTWAGGLEPVAFTLAMGVVALWIQMILPLTFVLLPVSRRRAKVRWRHLGRAWCYSLFIPSACGGLAMLAVAARCAVVDWLGPLTAAAHVAGRWLPIPLLVMWWVAAVRRYLRIPHAWTVVLMLALLGFLLLPAGLVLMHGAGLIEG